jgi:hypothetical protein
MVTAAGSCPGQAPPSAARSACDVLAPVYDRTASLDGCVSLEIDPRLPRDADAPIEMARRLRASRISLRGNLRVNHAIHMAAITVRHMACGDLRKVATKCVSWCLTEWARTATGERGSQRVGLRRWVGMGGVGRRQRAPVRCRCSGLSASGIPWIHLYMPGCAANLATGNGTDAQLNSVRKSRRSALGRLRGRPPGGKRRRDTKHVGFSICPAADLAAAGHRTAAGPAACPSPRCRR